MQDMRQNFKKWIFLLGIISSLVCTKPVFAGAATHYVVTSTTSSAPYSDPQVAGVHFNNVVITALDGSNAIDTGYTGTKTVKAWFTFINPSTSIPLSVFYNGTAFFEAPATPLPGPPFGPPFITLTFIAGVCDISLNTSNYFMYPDVGEIQFHFQDTTPPSYISGSSGNITFKPHHFAFFVPNNGVGQPADSTVSGPSDIWLPATADASCLNFPATVVAKAGAPFQVLVQVRNASNNQIYNFNRETPAQEIVLSSNFILAPTTNIMPSPQNGSANNGAIGGNTFVSGYCNPSNPEGFSPPLFSFCNASFDEVGCIQLTAGISGGSYLGTGDIAQPQYFVIGRFTPDHFQVTQTIPTFQTGCDSGGFTYLDQPFNFVTGQEPAFTVTAKALAGTTTQNYSGSPNGFFRLGTSHFHQAYPAITAQAPLTMSSVSPFATPPNIPDPTLTFPNSPGPALGVGTFTFLGSQGIQINRPVPPGTQTDFQANLQLSVPTLRDLDGVTCSDTTGCTCFLASGDSTPCPGPVGSTFGIKYGDLIGPGIAFSSPVNNGNTFYHGRVALINADGPETQPLVMPMQVQFFNSANGWGVNGVDNCSMFTGGTNNLALNKFPTTLNSSASLPTVLTFVNGVLNITLSPPGANNTGYIDVTAVLDTILPYLQYPWPSSGGFANADPIGRATFGIRTGNPRNVFQKEVIP